MLSIISRNECVEYELAPFGLFHVIAALLDNILPSSCRSESDNVNGNATVLMGCEGVHQKSLRLGAKRLSDKDHAALFVGICNRRIYSLPAAYGHVTPNSNMQRQHYR